MIQVTLSVSVVFMIMIYYSVYSNDALYATLLIWYLLRGALCTVWYNVL